MIQWLLLMGLVSASLASSCEDLSCEPSEKLLQVIRNLQQKLNKLHTSHGVIHVDPNMGVSRARLPRSALVEDVFATNNIHKPKCPPCPSSACDSNPCLNGGTCLVGVSPESENYKCDCPPNFTGDKCENELTCSTNTCKTNEECYVSDHQINCVCKRGYTSKGPRQGCLAKLRKSCAAGDPHYTTFDNLQFNYQGTCPYVFSQPCGNLTNGFSNYTVVVKNKIQDGTAPVSYVNEIEVTMYDQQVHIDLTTRKVYFNGNVISVPYYWPSKKQQKITVEFAGSKFFVRNDELIIVSLNTGANLCIEVPDTPEFRGNQTLCGLAGNIDGNFKDDIVMRDGSIYPVTKSFVKKNFALARALDTWITKDFRKLRNDEEPCMNGEILTNRSYVCKESERAQCDPILKAMTGEGPFAPCAEMENNTIESLYEACRFDMCHGSKKCDILTDFARECMSTLPNTDFGSWRELPSIKCEQTCPFNSHYSSCKSSCPATCAESTAPDFCDQPCSEGCTCDDGYVVDNTVTSKLTCIPIKDCGCTDENGNSFPANRAVLSYECQIRSQCENGSVTSGPNKCSTDGFCGTDASGDMACLCNTGFVGDGYNCKDINECRDPKSCSVDKKQGTCTNTVGSYHCDCNEFYDGSDCQYYHPRRHCADLYKYWNIKTSGVYTINPPYAMGTRPALSDIKVYCEMESDQDGEKGGWTLMSHDSGRGMADKTFNEYEVGFGSPKDQNVWLGLQIINGMTQEVSTSLLVNILYCPVVFGGINPWCKYRHFSVAGPSNNYPVTIPEACEGDGWATWDLTKQGPTFVAYDTPKSVCSEESLNTGWWFDTTNNSCGNANLNGVRPSCENVSWKDVGHPQGKLTWHGFLLADAWMYLRPTAYPNYDPHPVTPIH